MQDRLERLACPCRATTVDARSACRTAGRSRSRPTRDPGTALPAAGSSRRRSARRRPAGSGAGRRPAPPARSRAHRPPRVVGRLDGQPEDARPRHPAAALDLPAERVEPADRVLEAGARDVRPEPAPDLERAHRDEPAERLPDGRPAHPVAVHQLELGLDPGARCQLAGPDPRRAGPPRSGDRAGGPRRSPRSALDPGHGDAADELALGDDEQEDHRDDAHQRPGHQQRPAPDVLALEQRQPGGQREGSMSRR